MNTLPFSLASKVERAITNVTSLDTRKQTLFLLGNHDHKQSDMRDSKVRPSYAGLFFFIYSRSFLSFFSPFTPLPFFLYFHHHHHHTEQAGVAVMLLTCNRQVLGSNLGFDICYSEAFCEFPQFLQENAMIIPRLEQGRFEPNPFQFWYSGGWSPIRSTRHCGHQ
jgi:hypothetical protein